MRLKLLLWTFLAVVPALMTLVPLTSGFRAVQAEPQERPTVKVAIDNFTFSPATLTIPAGTTVTWTNKDDVPHTVVSDDKVFKSKVLDTDDSFTFTFDKAGTYPYFCSVHPKMTAKVVVE